MKSYKHFKIKTLLIKSGEYAVTIYNESGLVKINAFVGRTEGEALRQAINYINRIWE